MKRRAFLQLFCSGLGAAALASPASAFTFGASRPAGSASASNPPVDPSKTEAAELLPSVATQEDLDGAKVDTVAYGHWRRVNRRQTRRVSRRVYRRHYY